MTVGTSMTLSTAAVYAAGDAVITLGGIVKDDKVEWQVLPSTVVDGKIAPSRYRSYERLYELSAQHKSWEIK